MTRLTDKELAELINRLDPITLAVHKTDVAHISLIGYPADVFALDDYLMEKKNLEN